MSLFRFKIELLIFVRSSYVKGILYIKYVTSWFYDFQKIKIKKQLHKSYSLLPKPPCTYTFQMPSIAVCFCAFIHWRSFLKCHINLLRHLFALTDTFLLSSRTVFMLSIHRVSMGPSKITHLRSGVSDNANSLKVLAIIPSVH